MIHVQTTAKCKCKKLQTRADSFAGVPAARFCVQPWHILKPEARSYSICYGLRCEREYHMLTRKHAICTSNSKITIPPVKGFRTGEKINEGCGERGRFMSLLLLALKTLKYGRTFNCVNVACRSIA